MGKALEGGKGHTYCWWCSSSCGLGESVSEQAVTCTGRKARRTQLPHLPCRGFPMVSWSENSVLCARPLSSVLELSDDDGEQGPGFYTRESL
jgi:hypothetical protein